MASVAQAVPYARKFPQRLGEFIKAEMTLGPGTYAMLGRVVLAVVITFVIAATFRLPNAAISLYSVFTVDRSSRRAAALRTMENAVAITAGVAMALLGVLLFADFPLLTFLYYALELFTVAFLIRTTRTQTAGMNMGLAVYSVHNVWERAYPVAPHLESSLWVWATLLLGFLVSLTVEFAWTREDPMRQIVLGLSARLQALSQFYAQIAAGTPLSQPALNQVLSFAYRGTGSIRQQIAALRTTDPQMHFSLFALNTTTALVARLIDVSATFDPQVHISEPESHRLLALSQELDRVRRELETEGRITSSQYQPGLSLASHLPALPELERTVTLMPAAFSSQSDASDPVARSLSPPDHTKLFVADAFSNPGYLLFACKTMLAALVCYVIYSALDWPGISTSVVTCLVTALNTVGATNQKQVLRLAGAIAGGLVALAALVLLLPEFDSITSVTLLVAAVTALSARFALASPRISYFGLQTALAFYLALLQDYTADTRLSPARDRGLGVLLGLLVMWLIFNHLWPVSAAEHMRTGLANNIRLISQLITALDQPHREAAIQTIRGLRDRIQEGLAAVHGHADSVLFEVGSPDRERNLALRNAILRMQASLRALFVVEVAICQYRTQVVPGTRPVAIREAQKVFDDQFRSSLLDLAAAVDALRPPAGNQQLRDAFRRFEESVAPWAATLSDDWLASRVSGIRSLSQQAVTLAEHLRSDCVWC